MALGLQRVTSRIGGWSVRTKLFLVLAALGTGAVLGSALIGYYNAVTALEASIYNHLISVRNNKASRVEAFFQTTRDELLLLAGSKMVADAARGFIDGADRLERDKAAIDFRSRVLGWYIENFRTEAQVLSADTDVAAYAPPSRAGAYIQYRYIVENPHPPGRRMLLDDAGDGSFYSSVHATYHPLLRKAATTVRFEDFMIADARTGTIVYGMAKEIDSGSSLQAGFLKSSNLAGAVAHCATQPSNVTCFADFASYIPSGGAPIAFMASPIYDQGAVIAVLIAQLSIGEIDRAVTGNKHWVAEGFGRTGEAVLVGPDRRARSGSRAFYENQEAYFETLARIGYSTSEIDAIKRYGSPILHQRNDTRAARAALSGAEGYGIVHDSLRREVLASWGPLAVPGITWGLIAKIDENEALASIHRLERDLLLMGVLSLLVVLLLSAWLSRQLLGPLRALTEGVERFGRGDHTARVKVRSADEIGRLCAAFNDMAGDISAKTTALDAKNRENEELLLNILPQQIADRLRGGEQAIADGFADVTVIFADIVGFTDLSTRMPPQRLVALLNGLFSRFDQAAQELGVEKIKTVGDAYMAVCGLPVEVPDHIERAVQLAVRMVHITREHGLASNLPLQLRVGVHSGSVVAGVIGRTKYIYDLWGDTVNLASRMESGGQAGAIQVTRPVYERMRDKYPFESRGTISVKGRGEIEAWMLRLVETPAAAVQR